MRAGGTAPAVLNAANEVAVEAFLDGPARLPSNRRNLWRETLDMADGQRGLLGEAADLGAPCWPRMRAAAQLALNLLGTHWATMANGRCTA